MLTFHPVLKQKLAKLMPSYSEINWPEFEKLFVRKKIQKKENWINEYEKSDKVAIIESGLLRLFMHNSKGEEKTHSFVSEGGACLNHFWIYAKQPSPVIIQAVEDTDVLETTHTKIISLFKDHRCFEEMYRNLLVESFMFKLKREMFFVMYDASERLEHISEFPYVDIDRIPKIHLASFLGIKPQSFSRLNKKSDT